MKAPKYERLELLWEAIRTATDELAAPIDRVEVLNEYIQCWARSKTVTFSYHFTQGGSLDEHGNFLPYVGSGSWSVQVVRDPIAKRPTLMQRVLAMLFKRRTG